MNAILPHTPAPLGHNNPPPDPFEAISVHIDGLLTEAYNWADGQAVETQEQADEASRLIDDLRKAAAAADEQRKAENKPFDEGKAAVQAKYAPLIADPKTKSPGRVWKAIDALKAAVKPYLDRLERERQEAAAKAREEAEAAARKAAEAARAAAASDLAAQDAAEDLIAAAQQADAAAKRIENARAQARGGERAMGLRKTYTANITDPRALLLHYWATNREPLVACLQAMAQQDVDRKIHTLPGVEVIEGTRL